MHAHGFQGLTASDDGCNVTDDSEPTERNTVARIIAYQTDETITEWTRQDKTAAELAEVLRASGLWCLIPRPDGKITAILLGTSYHFTIEDTDDVVPCDVEA